MEILLLKVPDIVHAEWDQFLHISPKGIEKVSGFEDQIDNVS